MHWGWVCAAVLFDILVYFLQGWRWSLLLRPVAQVPYARSISAIYVGLFANEVLPLRTGELIRCYLQGRWSGLPFTVTLSSALIERIFDGVWLCVCLLVTTHFVALPELYITLGKVLAGLVLIGGALLVSAMFAKNKTHQALHKHPGLGKVTVLLDDLYIIGHSPYLYLSAAASLPYLLLQVLPIYALAQGYGVDITLGQGFALMVILRLVAVVPQAPGNLGDVSGGGRLRTRLVRRRFKSGQAILFCDVGGDYVASVDRRLHRAGDYGIEPRRHPEAGAICGRAEDLARRGPGIRRQDEFLSHG